MFYFSRNTSFGVYMFCFLAMITLTQVHATGTKQYAPITEEQPRRYLESLQTRIDMRADEETNDDEEEKSDKKEPAITKNSRNNTASKTILKKMHTVEFIPIAQTSARDHRAEMLQSFVRDSQLGDQQAIFKIGVCYEIGYGVAMNHEEALHYYQQAADPLYKSVYAAYFNQDEQYYTAYCYQYGIGCVRNLCAATDTYEFLAKKQYPKAWCSLGYLYCTGQHTLPVFYNGSRIPRRRIAEFRAFVTNNIVTLDEKKGFDCYLKAAQLGNTLAMRNLSYCYTNGVGVTHNEHKAKFYATHAGLILQDEDVVLGKIIDISHKDVLSFSALGPDGYPPAQYALAHLLQHTNSINLIKREPRFDHKKAYFWYTKAAKQGYTPAIYELGRCYEIGLGAQCDNVCSLEWYKKAAEKGYIQANNVLGRVYHQGALGVKANDFFAFDHYSTAAESGDPEAKFHLAYYFKNGIVSVKDIKKVISLYTEAADAGYVPAQIALADCYLNNFDNVHTQSGQNEAAFYLTSALNLYRFAASKNHADGCYKLALCYLNGIDCGSITILKKDSRTAMSYMKRSGDAGHANAKQYRARYLFSHYTQCGLKSANTTVHPGMLIDELESYDDQLESYDDQLDALFAEKTRDCS